jgi:hypothetical protein
MNNQTLTEDKKDFRVNTQLLDFIQVSEKAEEVIALGRRHHWRFRIITDFQGVIDKPVFNAQSDWVYMPLREEDKAIIPNAAYRRHEAIQQAGYRVAQVIIGHELRTASEERIAPSKPKSEIDWGNVAQVAGKGLLVVMVGIAMISFYALAGAVQLVDPSFCIVLAGDDDPGTVIELIRWNMEG